MARGAASIRTSRQGGFTLVELLVVVTVIVVLTGMLVPAALDAFQSGQETLCASNLRQLDFAFTVYLTENMGQVFGYHQSFDEMWMEQLRPYASDDLEAISYCPRAKNTAAGQSRGDVRRAWTGRYRSEYGPSSLHRDDAYHEGSFGFNGWLYNAESSSVSVSQQLELNPDRFFDDLMNLDNYVSTPVLADAVWYNAWARRERDEGLGTSVFDIPRHRGTINVVFLDGHAARVPLSDLFYLTWHKGFIVGPRQPPAPR